MRYYQGAITQGLILLPLIALIPLIPYYWKKRKRGIANPFRLLTFYSFMLYFLISWFFIVMPLPSEEWLSTINPAGVNLIPGSYFRGLSNATGFDLMESSTYTQALVSGFALQYWFNILMLVPMGMYLRYLFRMNAVKTACLSFLTTLLFEITQLTAVFGLFSKRYRSFDVDDLIMNFIGGMLGYFLMGRLMPLAAKIETLTEQAYRKGTHLSNLRRLAAIFVDANIVLGINRLLELMGLDLLKGDFGAAVFIAQMFLYTLLSSLLTNGATPGKLLLHFSIRHLTGARASAKQIAARYSIIYGTLLFYSLLPALAVRAGMVEQAIEMLVAVFLLFGASILGYYTIVTWMFPSRDYPWGSLSRTRAMLTPRKTQA